MYDFDKLVLFCILYCDADLNVKAQMLFYLMASEDDHIYSKGSKVKHIFSYLTVIACVITAEFIHSVSEQNDHTLMSVRYIESFYLPPLTAKLSSLLSLCANLLFFILIINCSSMILGTQRRILIARGRKRIFVALFPLLV